MYLLLTLKFTPVESLLCVCCREKAIKDQLEKGVTKERVKVESKSLGFILSKVIHSSSTTLFEKTGKLSTGRSRAQKPETKQSDLFDV